MSDDRGPRFGNSFKTFTPRGKVRHQKLNFNIRTELFYRAHGPRKMGRPPIGQVIARHRSKDHILQSEGLDGIRNTPGLIFIHG